MLTLKYLYFYLQTTTAYLIENRYWKISDNISRKNFIYPNVQQMEDTIECSVIPVTVGAYTKILVNLFQERQPKANLLIVTRFQRPIDQ